ncbi:MAG: hypothetical protein DRI57_03065 [Deltaproteobacteria bacterium]|nr:MAG: hypothetical protein DRI57_03065 [Deltaproteobacteria bacterium]
MIFDLNLLSFNLIFFNIAVIPSAGLHAGQGLQPLMPDGVCNPVRNILSSCRGSPSCRTGFATPHAGRGLQPRPKYFVLMPGFPKAICKIALHLCKITSCRTGFATPSEIFCPHAGVPPKQFFMPDSCRTGFATPSEIFCPHAGVPKSNL